MQRLSRMGRHCGRPSWWCSATAIRSRSAAAGQSARFLLVSGKPLGEPIARYGPFVMNTAGEIQQALEDLRNGTFVWGTRQM